MEGEGSAAPAKGHYQSDLSSDLKKVFYDGELRFEASSRSNIQGHVVSINVHSITAWYNTFRVPDIQVNLKIL